MFRDILRTSLDICRAPFKAIRRPPRGCYWVALHFPSQWQADEWLKRRATASECMEARQLMTGDRIRPCDI